MARLAFLFFSLACVSAFAPVKVAHLRPVQVSMKFDKSASEMIAATALSVLLAASSVAPLLVAPDAAMAARSGGRAGGSRSFSSAPRAAPRAAPRPSGGGMASPGGSTVINRNYYGGGGGGVMVAPMGGFGYSPFGYSPFGGLGTGYALGAMSGNNGGNQQVRQETYRLENQVEKETDNVRTIEQELATQQAQNAALEKRLAALESK